MKKGNSTTVIVLVAVLILLVLFFMVFMAGCAIIMFYGSKSGEKVAVIYLNGTIEDGRSGFYHSGITPNLVYNQLQRAAWDSSIRGVVLRVNSPGGSVAASQEIAAMIKQFEKPLVISMGDMAASGGYYISAPARGIVAQPGTMTGSIGVIMQVMNLEGLFNMLGIQVETIKSGRNKDMFSRALTEEERDLLQKLSDAAYEQFIMEIAGGRNMDPEQVRELATGQLFTGSQALQLGLVDRLGGIEEALAYVAEMAGLENPVRYNFSGPSPFSIIFGALLKIPGLIETIRLPSELIILEKIQKGFMPELRYQ